MQGVREGVEVGGPTVPALELCTQGGGRPLLQPLRGGVSEHVQVAAAHQEVPDQGPRQDRERQAGEREPQQEPRAGGDLDIQQVHTVQN